MTMELHMLSINVCDRKNECETVTCIELSDCMSRYRLFDPISIHGMTNPYGHSRNQSRRRINDIWYTPSFSASFSFRTHTFMLYIVFACGYCTIGGKNTVSLNISSVQWECITTDMSHQREMWVSIFNMQWWKTNITSPAICSWNLRIQYIYTSFINWTHLNHRLQRIARESLVLSRTGTYACEQLEPVSIA